jgi:hypothetical protein
MHALLAGAVILLLSLPLPAAAQTFLGVLSVPANTGPGGSCCSRVAQLDTPNQPVPDDGTCVGCSVITAAQYNAFQAATAVPGNAQQSASAKVSAGITLSCTTTPALSGTYAVTDTMMLAINTLWAVYNANGQSFPAAAANMTFLDTGGNLHTFPSLAAFQAFSKIVAFYWLQVLDWKQRTIAGQSPAAPSTASSAC